MTGLISVAAAAGLSLTSLAGSPAAPLEPCASVATVFPNYVPDWCGKRAPGGYDEFRVALSEFTKQMEQVMLGIGGVASDLHTTCYIEQNSTGPHPADPVEVDLIVARLQLVRKDIDSTNEARNRLTDAAKKVFAGDPNAAAGLGYVGKLQDVLSNYGRALQLVEEDGNLYAACNNYPAYRAAEDSLAAHESQMLTFNTEYGRTYLDIQNAFTATMGACKAVRVREEIPAKDMQKAGPVTRRQVGGASLVYPKSIDIGKKPKKLPVNVKSPAADYGSITLTRGSKGIVGTAGGFTDQPFGLLMTIPKGTKTGTATITFRTDSGVTVTGKIRLV